MAVIIGIVLFCCLFGGVAGTAIKLTWGIMKFVVGILVFTVLPVVFVVAIICGLFSYLLPAIIVFAILYYVFKHC